MAIAVDYFRADPNLTATAFAFDGDPLCHVRLLLSVGFYVPFTFKQKFFVVTV